MHTALVEHARKAPSDTLSHEDDLHLLFIEGVRQLLLVLRAIIYSESDPDHMARLELKRLNQLQRPTNLTDAQFWSEVVKRGRNWRTLLGPSILSTVGAELRDFLPNVATLLTDRHTLESLINLVNHWITGLAANYGYHNVFDLIGQDMKLSTRTAIYPPDSSGKPPPPITGHMFEKADCLRKIFDIGEYLRSVGKPTNGAELVWFFLDHTSQRIGETGVGATILGGDTSQMLYSDNTYCDQETYPLGNNDILFVSQELPKVHIDSRQYPSYPNSHPISGQPHKGNPKPGTPQQDTILEAVKEQNKNLLDTVNTSMAHLGELLRTQINTISPPDYRHAQPVARPEPVANHSYAHLLNSNRKVQFPVNTGEVYYASNNLPPAQLAQRQPQQGPSTYVVDPRAHQLDVGRRNMGGYGRDGRDQTRAPYNNTNQAPRNRFPPSRNLQSRELRYLDKPATAYEELNDDAKGHLASALGITSEEEWKRDEMKLCPLCANGSTPANHYLNRCLKLFCATERGKLFFGADKAATRLRNAMMENPTNHIAFETVLAITDGTMLNLDEQSIDVSQRVVDLIIDSSEPLTMYFINGMHLSDDLAIQEFDDTRKLVIEYLKAPFPPTVSKK